MVLILIGPPGSGKDTQAQLLADKMLMTVVSPGEALREAVESNHPLAAEIEEYINAGDLVPDNVTDQVIRAYLAKRDPENIVFTGFPRRVHQIEMLDKLLTDLEQELSVVIYLDVPENQIVERLAGRLYAPLSDKVYHPKYNPPKLAGVDDETGEPLIHREDDKPEAIQERLKVFHEYTQDVLDKFEDRGVLKKINGDQTIEAVESEILRVITGLGFAVEDK